MLFTWKRQLEGVPTSAKQMKKIQRYHGLVITHNVLSTSNPLDSEINVPVYTMKKNLIAILHHAIKAGDSAKQHRFCPPDRNSWFDWQQERWPIRDDCLPHVFVEWLYSPLIMLSYTELKWVHQFSGLGSVPKAEMLWCESNSLCCGFCSVTILSWNC